VKVLVGILINECFGFTSVKFQLMLFMVILTFN
jgi:hypothetical protein